MKKLLIPVLILFLFQACDKDDPAPSGNDHVNSWILENMQKYYYWADDLPANPDKSKAPDEFFESLKSPQDRFSWIQENFTELLNSLHGVNKEGGFEFALYRVAEGSDQVIMQILYVKPNSPASSLGLKRGDTISEINSTQITVSNYSDLIGKMSENFSLTYQAYDLEGNTWEEPTTINIVPVEYAEDPNFLSRIFTYDNHKIGYYIYNLFSEGPDENTNTYRDEMDAIFANFKSEGITDLVIDLRYNSGGAETAAQNLASLIAPGISTSTVFVKHEYNTELTNEIKNDPGLGEGFFTVPFLSKSDNLGSMLQGGRVYILTGPRTASASELIINGLKPFMDVYLIGDVTIGKNVGSITIYDETDKDNKWGMQPIITKIFNSNGQSDYTNGFIPQELDEDNSIHLYPLGDTRERLLSKAIATITGTPLPARMEKTEKAGELLFHSLDAKKRSGIVTIDLPF